MRIKELKISKFRNLVDFEIDLDKTQLITVLIGENGAGKSNLIEAIITIFRNLDLEEVTTFSYSIKYSCHGNTIEIESNPASTWNQSIAVKVSEKPNKLSQALEIKNSLFKNNKEKYLPNNVFAYYSGPSRRLEHLFNKHQNKFYQAQLKNKQEQEGLRRLFYARPVHSQFVLLAFYSQQIINTDLLQRHLGIGALESVLFTLSRPSWASKDVNTAVPPTITDEKDGRFWMAKGVVKKFLDKLWNNSTAPIYAKPTNVLDYKGTTATEQEIYLYLKDQKALSDLAVSYPSQIMFFKDLESMYISGIIKKVQVKIRRAETNEIVSFDELSEGEQQLLTVLGLLRFTNESESLFLLDEPDTHLNPHWKLRYLELLKESVEPEENSQLLIATHDPITIASLERTQVQVFHRTGSRNSTVSSPTESPQGLGIAGVLTEMFGLGTTLDKPTQDKLNDRNKLSALDNRTSEQQEELESLSDELAQLGFSRSFRDPILNSFYSAAAKRPEFQNTNNEAPATDEQLRIANEILDELLSKTDI
jgi:predicted ATPase